MPGGTAGLCRDGAAGAGRGGAAALGQRRGGERSARGSGAAVPCPVSAGGAGRGQAGRQAGRQAGMQCPAPPAARRALALGKAP